MARMSTNWPGLPADSGLDLLGHEILAEKAAALGRSAQTAEKALARLRGHSGEENERAALVKQAADAVYAYFVQRELCGFRKHDEIIRDYAIPRQVLARLGAK